MHWHTWLASESLPISRVLWWTQILLVALHEFRTLPCFRFSDAKWYYSLILRAYISSLADERENKCVLPNAWMRHISPITIYHVDLQGVVVQYFEHQVPNTLLMHLAVESDTARAARYWGYVLRCVRIPIGSEANLPRDLGNVILKSFGGSFNRYDIGVSYTSTKAWSDISKSIFSRKDCLFKSSC